MMMMFKKKLRLLKLQLLKIIISESINLEKSIELKEMVSKIAKEKTKQLLVRKLITK
jgi:hypothetical protein